MRRMSMLDLGLNCGENQMDRKSRFDLHIFARITHAAIDTVGISVTNNSETAIMAAVKLRITCITDLLY